MLPEDLQGQSMFLIAALSVLSVAPGILVMVTCFPFIVTVFSILRQGIGLQSSPPNIVIISLSIFLTYFIMEPVFADAYQNSVLPYVGGQISLEKMISSSFQPFESFMQARTSPEIIGLISDIRIPAPGNTEVDTSIGVLIPSFMLSEISKAFQVGFFVLLPFLIIDLVVSAVLMSMGMMMVPPSAVSLPFKIAFFVSCNGWALISSSIVSSYR